MRKLIKALDTANDLLVNLLKYLLALVLVIQILLIFMTAFMRYVFNHPLSWTDELTTYLLVMITFLGAYVASNTGVLAKVELFSGMFQGTLRKMIDVIARLLSAGLVGWIAFYGTQLFLSPVIQNQTSSALQMPVKYVWWTLPVTMWLLLFSEILGIIHIFVPRKDQLQDSADPEPKGDAL